MLCTYRLSGPSVSETIPCRPSGARFSYMRTRVYAHQCTCAPWPLDHVALSVVEGSECNKPSNDGEQCAEMPFPPIISPTGLYLEPNQPNLDPFEYGWVGVIVGVLVLGVYMLARKGEVEPIQL